ncbi:type II toxin-antitoxin system RelE/ParE family toxin [Gemmata sp. G18]|uniref:Type II toxin-antitoxin system RelE/ParE family toxin n=1 Tax=Gemmata palustris TaxID=2822762 RepID=A0ABS5BQT1_9BACT|nr:type II toxin-antitoxin system RelE/ParE family toxin [Gemmata palustris]
MAARFVTKLDTGIAAIGAEPARFPSHQHGTRFYRLPRFPYLLIYFERDSDTVLLLAVMHTRRRPAYWHRRLP